jgi:hypothetical protein
MKKQTPKAKRLTEAKAKHLKTVKRRQLSEIKKSIGKYQRLMETKVYTAGFPSRFGSFIEDFITTVGSDNNVEMGGGSIEVRPENFQAWDEFGYEKQWSRIPDGQPFTITGDTVGLTDYPSLKNYTFVKNGGVIKGEPSRQN